MTAPIVVPGLPFEMTPTLPSAWRIEGTAVVAEAPATTDLYVDPAGGDSAHTVPVANATMLLGSASVGDFQFSARVEVDFRAQYDAGVLVVWIDDRHWAKFCFEFSPDSEPMVVTVVTRGVSDDANSFVVDGRSVWLRVSRLGPAYAFHASLDGGTWRFVRVFTLGDDITEHRIGFEAQSPTGAGCMATFDEVRYTTERLRELRDGS